MKARIGDARPTFDCRLDRFDGRAGRADYLLALRVLKTGPGLVVDFVLDIGLIRADVGLAGATTPLDGSVGGGG